MHMMPKRPTRIFEQSIAAPPLHNELILPHNEANLATSGGDAPGQANLGHQKGGNRPMSGHAISSNKDVAGHIHSGSSNDQNSSKGKGAEGSTTNAGSVSGRHGHLVHGSVKSTQDVHGHTRASGNVSGYTKRLHAKIHYWLFILTGFVVLQPNFYICLPSIDGRKRSYER